MSGPMRGWSKAVIAILIAAVLVLAAIYIVRNFGSVRSPNGEDHAAYQVVVIDNATVELVIDAFPHGATLSSLTLALYGPGLGQGWWDLSTPPERAPIERPDILPGVDARVEDANHNGLMDKGDLLTVVSPEGGLREGIWHMEVRSSDGFLVDLGFQMLPSGFSSAGDLSISFLDVGQGDAELIHTSDDRWVLVDAGPAGSEEGLLAMLHEEGVDRLEALVITHPHLDHYAGADEVLETFEVMSVYHPGLQTDSVSFQVFLDAAEAEGCPVLTDEEIDAGDYLNISLTENFRVLSIDSKAEDVNDASIVLRVSSADFSVLFTGDIGEKVERRLLETYPEALGSDVLKVAHHGSRHSSSSPFLEAVSPRLAVIEVGDNSYGHPHEEAVQRLTACGAVVHRTDEGSLRVDPSWSGPSS